MLSGGLPIPRRRQRDMKVVRASDMAERSETEQPEVRDRRQVPPPGAPDRAETDGVYVPAPLGEVERVVQRGDRGRWVHPMSLDR